MIGELTNEDGTMSRLPECQVFARRFGLKLITIEALVAWRKEHEAEFIKNKKASKKVVEESKQTTPAVELLAECKLPIQRDGKDLGEWTLRCYLSHLDNLRHHLVLIKGKLSPLYIFLEFAHLFFFFFFFLLYKVMWKHWQEAKSQCWLACTLNASPETFWEARGAIAANSCLSPSLKSPRRAKECLFM